MRDSTLSMYCAVLRARPDARDEAAVLAHVLREVVRVEHDRGVEVGEEHDDDRVQHVVEPAVSGLNQVAELRRADGPAARTPATVVGRIMMLEAKMIGITPAVFTRSGMCVLAPPYIAPADDALGVLHRDLARGLRHHDDHRDDRDHDAEDQRDLQHAEAAARGSCRPPAKSRVRAHRRGC